MQKKRNSSRPAPRFGANKKKNTTGRKKFDGPRFARNDGSLAEDYQRDTNGNAASLGSSKKRISTGAKPYSRKPNDGPPYSSGRRTEGFRTKSKPGAETESDTSSFSGRRKSARPSRPSFSENKRPSRTDSRNSFSRKPAGNRFSREKGDDNNPEPTKRDSRDSYAPRKRTERSGKSGSEEKQYSRPAKPFDKRNTTRSRTSDSPRKRPVKPYGNESEARDSSARSSEKRGSSRTHSSGKFSRETPDRKPAKRFSEKRDAGFIPRDRQEKPTSYKDDSRFKSTKRPAEKRSGKNNGKKEDAAAKESIRLNKYIANAGICSRREADEYIRSGVVTVNGKAVKEMGYQVQEGDVVKFGDRAIRPEKPVYILLNKPKDYITTTDDPDGRHIVTELVKVKERVFPVGRLDRNTTGVLLLTNDGDLAERLMHPKYEVPKVYLALLDKRFEKRHMEQLLEGVELEDGPITPDELAYVEGDKKKIGVVIHSGRNRIVHRMFNHLGYSVEKLDRTSYAGLTKRDLKRSEWRTLTPEEVMALKRLVKLKGKY